MTAGTDVMFVGLICSATGQPGVGRFTRTESGWELTGASRQRPGTSVPPGDGAEATGAFYTGPGYRGCPSCGAIGFVRCGGCGVLGCWHDESGTYRCPGCGRSGPITGEIESVSSLGGG